MKFKANSRRRALEYEKAILDFWKENKVFEQSVERRSPDNAYVFYDGPPFITGVPHHGTLLSSIIKDVVPRYWTMQGKRVERVWGWDCHGLPAENFVEKQLGIVDRRQIVARADDPAPLDKDGNALPTISLETYITKARESMVANSETWQGVIDRIGRWVDFKGAYRTMDKNFMESVWWAFKQLYEAGKIYEGEKVLMYDTKFATPVSKAEVTMDNDAYQTVTDPSVYVKFKLADDLSKYNFVLLHGYTGRNDKNFFPWLKAELEKCGATVQVLQLPNTDNPVVIDQMNYVLKNIKFDENTVLVGHSLGGLVAMKVLEKISKPIHKLILVAPATLKQFYEPGEDINHKTGKQEAFIGSFDYQFDFGKISQQAKAKIILQDDNDTPSRVPSMQFIAEKIQAQLYNTVANKNHFRAEQEPFILEKIIDSHYVLAWSTTPWTLPANLMLAVNPELTYAEVLVDGERLILAKNAIEQVLTDEKHQPLEYELVREFPGSELAGRAYQPLDTGSTWPKHSAVHHIYSADFVASDSGTGIVHIAPAYGEDDFMLAKQHGVGAFHVIDDNGYYFDSNYKGLEVWDNNKFIAKDLKEKDAVWKIDYIRHEYPFNPRSKQRIMYRAIPSWFMDIEHQKPLMLEENEHINWFPAHLKHGRFAKNIDQAPDWNLSRDRFWATAMPVWKSPSGKVKVVGSYAELEELSGVKLDDYHRPWVDEITFEIDGEKYTRVDKVLDCWFESGSMPFAQLHYPFENKQKFEQNYPADFIVEYVGQVRAWFYYVHAVNTALAEIGAFGDNLKHKNAFKNVITTGVVAGNDGRKMSKSLGNFTDPNELMDKFSADSLRFLLIQSPLLNGEDFALLDKDVADVARKLTMIWNMYDFFTMYAEVDNFAFPYDTSSSDAFLVRGMSNTTHSDTPESLSRTGNEKSFLIAVDLQKLVNPLDRWVVSRVHQLRNQITDNMNVYDIPHAVEDVLLFIDDASNWFVRRSRRRFWKSEDDADKHQAYQTLHYVLSYLALILAPFVPFLSEELWQKMVGGESVHLQNWPEAGQIDEPMVADMAELRGFVNEALALRAKAGVKIRQPLAEVVLPRSVEGVEWFSDILLEELNVKRVSWQAEASAIALDFTITPDLKNEGLAREVIRAIQNGRKKAGLNVDDRINLALMSDDQALTQAIVQFKDEIYAETLAIGDQITQAEAYDEMVQVEKMNLAFKLEKTSV